jgi:acetyl esterase
MSLDFATLTAAEFRTTFTPPSGAPGPAVARVDDRTIPGAGGDIPIRIYQPPATRPLPMTLYLHGGGFVIGDIEMTDAICRTLGLAAGCLVISVDYRLAPETPFPGGLLDAATALDWVHDNAEQIGGRPDRIAVAGDSSGATFAAVLAQRSRHLGPRVHHQLLCCPALDHRCDTETFRDYADGYLLTAELMRWYWRQYLRHEDHGLDAYASPAHQRDLHGVPPATIHTAEYDVLRAEAEHYAADLVAAGVETEIVTWRGQIHGFLLEQGTNPAAAAAITQAGQSLAAAFARQ